MMNKSELINKWQKQIEENDKMEEIFLGAGDYIKAHDLHQNTLSICRLLEELKNLTIPVVSGSALECYNCGKKMKPEDMYCGKC